MTCDALHKSSLNSFLVGLAAGDLQNHRLLMAFYPAFNEPMHLLHLHAKVSIARCITSHSRSTRNDVELQENFIIIVCDRIVSLK